ncbi:MAG: hypothetical protein J7527_01695 [Chitinophagaceae bacterium]|nr:hypothetical protein [Chitinophagaceae bacterium]
MAERRITIVASNPDVKIAALVIYLHLSGVEVDLFEPAEMQSEKGKVKIKDLVIVNPRPLPDLSEVKSNYVEGPGTFKFPDRGVIPNSYKAKHQHKRR